MEKQNFNNKKKKQDHMPEQVTNHIWEGEIFVVILFEDSAYLTKVNKESHSLNLIVILRSKRVMKISRFDFHVVFLRIKKNGRNKE